MRNEIDDLVEHLERFRGVTLQFLDLVEEAELGWRPSPDQYSIGQQLLHLAQTERFYTAGLFDGRWSMESVRFPARLPGLHELRRLFAEARAGLLPHVAALRPEELGRIVDIPGSPLRHSLRSWLWFLVEHENHHKGQLAVYLRLLGRTPPFYAMPLDPGARPDVGAREELGGF